MWCIGYYFKVKVIIGKQKISHIIVIILYEWKKTTQTKTKMQPMKFEFRNNGLTLSWLGKKDRIHFSSVLLIVTRLFLGLQYFFLFFLRQDQKKLHY